MTALLCAGSLLAYTFRPPPSINILILGSDARPDTGEDHMARTDSIMILGINPSRKMVSLFSLPRDVTIFAPGYGDLRANTIVRNAELNQPGSGIATMIASIEYTFSVPIHHYVWVDFSGFVDLVDALGGVDIEVPKNIIDEAYPAPEGGKMRVEFRAGAQHMDGATALIYARTRHSDTDYQRAGRQQQVIDAVLGKLHDPFTILRLPLLWRALRQNVRTDMGVGDYIAILPGILLYGHSQDQINRLVAGPTYLTNSSGEAHPNLAKIGPWMESHLDN